MLTFQAFSLYNTPASSSPFFLHYREQCLSFRLSVKIWLFATPWTATFQASLSFTISGSLLKLTVHRVGDAIQPCHPLSSLLLPPSAFQSQGLFLWVSSSNNYPGLISFRTDCSISLQSKWLSRVFSSTTVWKHQFFSAQPSLRFNSQHEYWKNHSCD